MILDATNSNDYLKAVRDGSFKMGLGIGCDLDNHYVWKPSDFDVFAGHANVGKTDWIIWYRVCLSIKHSLSWLIYSSENSIGSIKCKIIEYYTGKKVPDLTDDEFIKFETFESNATKQNLYWTKNKSGLKRKFIYQIFKFSIRIS